MKALGRSLVGRVEAARGDENFKRLGASAQVFSKAMAEIVSTAPGWKGLMEGLPDFVLSFAAVGGLLISGKGLKTLALDTASFVDLFREKTDELRAERDKLLREASGSGREFLSSAQLTAGFLPPVDLAQLQEAPTEGADFASFRAMLQRFSPMADDAAGSTQRFRDSMNGLRPPLARFGEEYTRTFAGVSEVTSTAIADLSTFEAALLGMQGSLSAGAFGF